MKIRNIIIVVFIAIISIPIFNACDVIDESEIWIPLYADRNLLSELIVDENLDETTYNEFKALNDAEPSALFMLVPITLASNNVEANHAMFNRIISKGGSYGYTSDKWEERFDFEIAKKDKGDFEITINYKLDESIANVACEYKVKSLIDYNENVELTVYILKDTIVGVHKIEVDGIVQYSELVKSASSLYKSDVTFNGTYEVDFSSHADIYKMSLMFAFSNSATGEILQATQINLEPSGDAPVFGTKQNILVEDFTGHKCGNCPDAHVELASLVESNGSQVIPMAIHTGYFAEVDAPDYATDFNTGIADAIASEFGVQFTPTGLVNRKGDEGDKLVDYPAWGAEVLNYIDQAPKLGIAIQTTLAGANLQANLYVKALEEYSGNLKIQAFILESKIHADQLWYGHEPEHIHDYEHEHVLRASVNGTWGEALSAGVFLQDDIVETNLSYALQSEWNADNLTIVVIVYNEDTKEIIQVEQADL